MNTRLLWSLIVMFMLGLAVPVGYAQEGSKRSGKRSGAKKKPSAKKKAAKKGKKRRKGPGKQTVEKEEEDPLEDTSTSFDFDETLLEGKFKAPSGMVLKGRVQQSKSQMVQLRKNFRPDLKKSSAAVRSIRPRD